MRTTAMRDYERMARRLAGMHESASREERMQRVADTLWEGLNECGVSWVGFYVDRGAEEDDRRLVLGPCRDKAACSPIGLHGVCGQALVSRAARIVRDVAELGERYVACDPRDRSEIVIPLFDESGSCWGVLDLDSHDVGSFDESDETGLTRVLAAAGLA